MTTLVPKYDQGATGAVNRPINLKLAESVSVLDFGAVADGVISPSSGTDNGPAFRAALLALATAGGGTLEIPFGIYRITTTVIIPSNIIIKGNNSFIVGAGIGSATDLFQSGYYSSGAIITNIGTAVESHTVSFSIYDLTIYYCGKAFNFYDVVDGSIFERISFNDCTYAMYLDRCFYASFRDINSRGTASGATNAAIFLNNVNNVQNFCSVFVNGRVLGWQIGGGSNALKLFNCSAESCETGVYITNETGPIAFDTCYFENMLTGAATAVNIDSLFDKLQISFTNCFFNGCTTGIKMPTDSTTRGRVIVDATNRFNDCTTFIDSSVSSIYHQNRITYTPEATNADLPVIPTQITVSKGDIVDCNQLWYDDAAAPAMRSMLHGTSLIPFNHEGNGGTVGAGANAHPFIAVSNTGSGATVSLILDTKIVYDKHTSNVIYRLTVADSSTTVELYGLVFGTLVSQLDAVGKTVVASDNGGYLRITISNFNTTTNVKGIIRFI
jgi:hypothetical protein